MNRVVHRRIYCPVSSAVGNRSVLDCCGRMGRPKKFNREGVLERAIPVFWKQGFANTTVQHLEQATGVNKSGLYTEFKGKEDLFLASLERYVQTRGAEILTAQPLGWGNIERFLRLGFGCDDDQRGCFAVNSMRRRVVADTRNALTLPEAAYPPVQYIPGEDVDFSELERTDHVTYCRFAPQSAAPDREPHPRPVLKSAAKTSSDARQISKVLRKLLGY